MILPKLCKDFMIYMSTIQGKSQNTVKEYHYDLQLFCRYILSEKENVAIEAIHDISKMTIEDFKDVSLEDMYAYLNYCQNERQNNARTRSRKVASIKTFYKYLRQKRKLIMDNPADELESPKTPKKAPVYLDEEESRDYIESVQTIEGTHAYRNQCIVYLFLNLGLRVSELCNIDIQHIKGDYLTVTGKGDKQRTLFLNETCQKSIETYILNERNEYKAAGVKSKALFLSQKGNRISRVTVYKLVKKMSDEFVDEDKRITPHKLRHTSATSMYRAGADIRSIQQILGHTSIQTTQIYTHVEDKQLKEIIDKNPFNIKR